MMEKEKIIERLKNSLNADNIGDYIKEFVEKNRMLKIKMKDIALHLNISNFYLSIFFKKKFDWTLTEYLIKFRIEKFCTLIKEENIKFNEAAQIVGYDDYPQFSKLFKK